MRLLDLHCLPVRCGIVFSHKEVAEPRAWQLPDKTIVLVGRPKVSGIAEALLQTVVLVVADAFVLRFELGCGVKDGFPFVSFCRVEAAVGEDDEIPVFGGTEIRRKNGRRGGKMATSEDVLGFDVEADQEVANGDGKSIHRLAV